MLPNAEVLSEVNRLFCYCCFVVVVFFSSSFFLLFLSVQTVFKGYRLSISCKSTDTS